MAELENNNKKDENIVETNQENENTEKKKGFFAKLWEGIQNFFGAIAGFFVGLFSPRDVIIIQQPDVPDLGNNQNNQNQQNENDLDQSQNTKKEQNLEQNPDIDEELDVDEEQPKSLFSNKDITTFIEECEKKNPNIVQRMEAIMNFKMTDENKEDFAKYVFLIKESINEIDEKTLQKHENLVKSGNIASINFEVAKMKQETIEKFDAFVNNLIDGDHHITPEAKQQIAKVYVDIAKENFINYAKERCVLSRYPIPQEEFDKIVESKWEEAIGSKYKGDVFADIQSEVFNLYHKLNPKPEIQNEKDEFQADYSDFFAPPTQEEIGTVEESEFGKIINTCKKDTEGRPILEDVVTIKKLMATIVIDQEDPDPEMQYMKNQLVEALKIVNNGEKAVWLGDGVEVYSIADNILNNEGVPSPVTIEDDDPSISTNNNTQVNESPNKDDDTIL